MNEPTISLAAKKFLAEPRNLILSTIRRDGRPQVSPVWFLWRGGEFLISTTVATAKWKNLQRDQRCTGIVDSPEGPYLIVFGVAVLSTENEPHLYTSEIVGKYKPGDEFEPYMETVRQERPDRGIIRVKPDKIITNELD